MYRSLPSLGGAALIVLGVLIVLHDFAFGGKISSQHVDLLSSSLPNYCFMGKTLAAGHLPSWNPYTMGGVPATADPQSGWMYLPAMLLFAVLPCGVAMSWFIVIQPILAGLGVYWFLRSEDMSRPSASMGGVVLALATAGSRIIVDPPFAGLVPWTALLLAAASRCFRASNWRGRLIWVALTAVCWGQLSAAFLGSGAALGTAALLLYGAARTIVDIRSGRLQVRDSLVLWVILLTALPLVNLAYFLPLIAHYQATTFALGYTRLLQLGARLTGSHVRVPIIGTARKPVWPIKMAVPPGIYIGGVALLLTFAGWWWRGHGYLIAAVSAFGLLSFLATLKAVALAIPAPLRSWPLADIYFHAPLRFGYGVLPASAAASALGLEAWRHAGSNRNRVLMLIPGASVWCLLPVVLPGSPFRWTGLFVAGVVIGTIGLVLSARFPGVVLLIPLLLAVELGMTDTQAQRLDSRANGVDGPVLAPTVNASAYLHPGPFVGEIKAGNSARFMSLDRDIAGSRGYLPDQTPDDWGLLANQRGELFGLQDVQGYNTVQLRRFWTFVRSVSPIPLEYNSAVFADPPPIALNLLQIGWVVGPARQFPLSGTRRVARDGDWALYRLQRVPGRSSVVSSWTETSDSGTALRLILSAAFDPARTAVVEGRAPAPPLHAGRAGTSTFESLGQGAARIVVDTRAPGVLVVRNPYDPGWRATIDGRPVGVLPTDYLLQGVLVPAGHHVVLLQYEDASVRNGLAGSGLSIGILLGAAFVLGRREKLRAQGTDEPSLEDDPDGTTSVGAGHPARRRG
jgi:hypothetical protein